MNTNFSIILTQDQRKAIEKIAEENYNGNMGRAIRAALEVTYPAFKELKKVDPVGPKSKRKKM